MSSQPTAPAPYALVVDDDAMIRMNVVDILTDAGFRTFEAETGDKAIPLLEREQECIVLLFSDVQMPGARNGFALARETAERWPHISIVIASGNHKPGPSDMPEGACFIAKPFSAETVHAHIQEILPDGQKPEPLKNSEC
ncbi:response regulator [Methylorubrum rhodesianum]|uniref:response regulator n=1 Tax=Methylorubrum rhodesianum TaxID=29427 RepID=UPI003CFD97B2